MRNVGIAMVMVVVFGAASLASAQDMRDSTNWEKAWEFDTDPTGGWVQAYGTPADFTTVAGGLLNFKPTTGWQLWNTQAGSNPLGTGDWSYEWRVQVVSLTGLSPLVYADTNSDKENVNFGVNFAGGGLGQVTGKFNVAPTSPVGDGAMESCGIVYSGWHTYRLTRTTGTGTPGGDVVGYSQVAFYVDNDPTPIEGGYKNLAMTLKNADDTFLLGNGSATGEYNIDYVRWTTAGAYGPIPSGPLPVTVTGTVVPGNYVGDVSDLNAIIELWRDGALLRTDKKVLAADGGFSIPLIPQDTYDVKVRVAGWLKNVHSGVVVSDNSTNLGTYNLIGGDRDGDNEITSSDLSIMLTNMDLVGG
ncbi:MAG: hypothetical protein WC975_15155 [Phycisphaerae bacterium]